MPTTFRPVPRVEPEWLGWFWVGVGGFSCAVFGLTAIALLVLDLATPSHRSMFARHQPILEPLIGGAGMAAGMAWASNRLLRGLIGAAALLLLVLEVGLVVLLL